MQEQETKETRTTNLPEALQQLPHVIVVCGHYGVGKTTFCLNLATDLSALGRDVCLVDLDVVNPYFRSSDYPQILEQAGVDLLSPHFARTALDAPMLSGRIGTELSQAHRGNGRTVIVDAGGDDAGATALGSYADQVHEGPYAMLYVVNAFREQTRDAAEAAAILPQIEAQSHCTATAIVNNAHLKGDTSLETIEHGREFAEKVSKELSLPILCTTLPIRLQHCVDSQTLACDSVYLVQEYVATPWEA